MKINRTSAILFLFTAGTIALRAQPAAVQQFQNSQLAQPQLTVMTNLAAGKAAPELYQGENTDVGPQRILRLNPRPLYFDVLLDSQVFYTDNANFSLEPSKLGSTVFVNTLQAAFTPPDVKFRNGRVSTSLGFASQWYNYESQRLNGLDFNAQTFFLGSKYTAGPWQVGLSFNYTRLVNQPHYDTETYHEFLPALTVQRIFPLGEKMLVALANQVDYHFSDTPDSTRDDVNDRFDDAASVTFSWQLTPRLVFQPYYRFQYSHYHFNTLQTTDRDDFLHTAGVTLAYYFNQTASVRIFFSYNRKQSSDDFTPAYLEYGGGLGASLNFKF